MICHVSITNRLDFNVTVSHSFEQIIDTTEESREFGEQCAKLMNAYLAGFGNANLRGFGDTDDDD